MEPTAGRLALVLCAGAVLVAAMLAAAFVDAADDVTIGHVFSTQSGDNVDVEAVRDGADGACMHVSGFRYASATSCFGLETAADRGSYQVVIPTKAAVPPLVIGLLPSDAHGAPAIRRRGG